MICCGQRGRGTQHSLRSTSLESAPDRSHDVPPADERKGKATADGDHCLGKLIIIHRSTLTRYPAGTMAAPRRKNVAGIPVRASRNAGPFAFQAPFVDRDVGCRAAKMHRSRWRTMGARAWVRPGDAEVTPRGRVGELKRPPGNIRRPPGLKISWFRKNPVRPGCRRFALAGDRGESKLLFPSEEQQCCCGDDTRCERGRPSRMTVLSEATSFPRVLDLKGHDHQNGRHDDRSGQYRYYVKHSATPRTTTTSTEAALLCGLGNHFPVVDFASDRLTP